MYCNKILGGIVGDIIGSTRERKNIKTEDFELLPLGSHFTDDTVMTLAVAKWLLTDPLHTETKLIECLQQLGREYPHAGYGGMFRKWLYTENPQPYGSFGNGSAMRVSPVGMYASSMEEALELARITASVTHNHPEGIKGAQAIAACIYLKRTEQFDVKTKIKRYIEEHFGYNLDVDLKEIRDDYHFDVTCQGSVPIAIMAYLQAPDSVEKAIRLAISMGGDSDTIGCMTASIAAVNGPFTISSSMLPYRIKGICRKLLPNDLLDINDKFLAFINRPRNQSPEVNGDQETVFADEHPNDQNSEDLVSVEYINDCIRGSLMGGAAGDALGYPVEFMSRRSILDKYGPGGITTFELDSNGKAEVSDDTQMTLFTANGMLSGITRGCMRGIGGIPETYVNLAYIDWYYTQTNETEFRRAPFTWIRNLPEMANRRAPGNTCLSACADWLDFKTVQNNSKGCGGIMRVAPMGLLLAADKARMGKCSYSIPRMFEAGAYIAKATHLHPLGFLPAGMMTELIFKLVPLNPDEAKKRICDIAEDTIKTLDDVYPGEYASDKHYLAELTRKAIRLAQSDTDDYKAIEELGEGWTGEEAWAISLFCTIRHIDSIHDAIVASVNHNGDSDSTGSITGNIMGAIYGYEEIKRQNLFCPEGKKFEDTIELSNIILALADDLTTNSKIDMSTPIDTPDRKQWYERYWEMKPVGLKQDNHSTGLFKSESKK